MTELAWLTLSKIRPLLAHASQSGNKRRVILFGCACCRCAQDWSLPPPERAAIEATERHADGEIVRRTWLKYVREIEKPPGAWDQWMTDWEQDFRSAVIQLFYQSVSWVVPDMLLRAIERVSSPEYTEAFEAKLCSVIRDIYGNPFRPVTFSPDWRTDTAVSLANQMYEYREFSAMPILADALQDAGCDSEEMLNHCRDPKQVHVRGCWAVDLVLGKA